MIKTICEGVPNTTYSVRSYQLCFYLLVLSVNDTGVMTTITSNELLHCHLNVSCVMPPPFAS